ncbi:hypothetical protein A374_18134 [Fictibacillus macauensis ZFHKF-1]|uniref:Lipoprotein n=1 Tax=Fictibacillus macauensis ZFHKF-1 TaxID=1196324 RepID=I8UAP2_9BACL|nr:hypothetical protein [Fictibacillus macauensis]EIT83980.1 hypothetical protein A374_18134 [Fictibacillus macauensis ZFHKF-1]
MKKWCILCVLLSFVLAGCGESSAQHTTTVKPVSHDTDVQQKWSGEWKRSGAYDGGSVTITKEKANSFQATFEVTNGAHLGYLKGTGSIRGNEATVKEAEFDTGCILTVKRNGAVLNVTANDACSEVGGEGTSFEGTYSQGKEKENEESKTLVGKGQWITASVDEQFKTLFGKKYETLAANFQLVSDSYDETLQADVLSGAVRGLYGTMEGVIMKDSAGKLYGATIIDGKKVLYITNNKSYSDRLPKAIQAWRKQFKGYPVSYVYQRL